MGSRESDVMGVLARESLRVLCIIYYSGRVMKVLMAIVIVIDYE